MAKKKHYATLGVSEDASTETIRKAHRRRVRDTHPDRNPGDDGAKAAFAEVQAAFRCLTDENARQRYDETGEDGEAPRAGFADLIAKGVIAVMTEEINAGSNLDTTDILAKLTAKMKECLRLTTEARNKAQLVLAKLRSAKKRVREPDSIVATVIGTEIARVSNDANGFAVQIPPIEEAIRYLAKCAYDCDKRKEEIRNMLNGASTIKFFVNGTG